LAALWTTQRVHPDIFGANRAAHPFPVLARGEKEGMPHLAFGGLGSILAAKSVNPKMAVA
jgi:hypothetical protein